MYNMNSGYGKDFIVNALKNATGKVFFVSAVTTGAIVDMVRDILIPDPDGVLRFYTSIDSAVNNCVANRGDKIVVLPGHTETLSSATALNLDIAGVEIVGIGRGTLVPTITLDTATSATIPVSAVNISIKNVVFSANFADIVSLFTLTTAKNFTLEDCYFKATATNMNFLSIVDTNTTNNAADGLTIKNCKWIEPDTATLYMVKGDADIDQLTIQGCYLNLGVNASNLPALVNMATGKDLTNAVIGGASKELGNMVVRLNTANPLLVVTDTTTANNGVVANNFVRHADTVGELLVTAGTKFGYFDNRATAVDDASGFLLPAADS